MSDQKAKVKSYVRRRLESWQHEPNPHQIRADLANLRRGIGKAPGDLPELWGLLFRDFPEELMSRNRHGSAQGGAAEIQCLCHCAEHAGVPAPSARTGPASEKRGHPTGLCGAGRRFVRIPDAGRSCKSSSALGTGFLPECVPDRTGKG